jgi:hypothetical protein
MYWHTFTAAVTGNCTSLNAYINSIGTAVNLYMALYNAVGTKLVSGSVAIATGLNTITVGATTITAGQQYSIAFQGDQSTNIVVADDGTTNQCRGTTNTAGTFPTTLPTGIVSGQGVPSVYAGGYASVPGLIYHRKNVLYFT